MMIIISILLLSSCMNQPDDKKKQPEKETVSQVNDPKNGKETVSQANTEKNRKEMVSQANTEDNRKEIKMDSQKKAELMELKNNKWLKTQGDWTIEDQFVSNVLNKEYWNAVERDINYNNELQIYRKEQVSAADGILHMTAIKKDGMYVSGLVDTRNKISLHYGTIEFRAKIPQGKGMFPAVWLLPAEDKHLPEIDILESIGDPLVYMVQHWSENGELATRYESVKLGDPQSFHNYKLVWNQESIQWFIDGKLAFQSKENVPQEPMYLIMNLAVGGNWPGSPDETTVFPSSLQIDYVKITQTGGMK